MTPAPIPDEKPAMLRGKMHYLLAYDGSEHAQAAIQLLLDLPCACSIPPEHCSVTLMSVLAHPVDRRARADAGWAEPRATAPGSRQACKWRPS